MWSAKRTSVRTLALCAVFLGLSLMLSYIEHLFPISAILPLPGYKPGLANIIVMLLAIRVSMASAITVSLLRVFLMALLFGGATSFWFSLCGALLSLLTVALIQRMTVFSFIGLSILSAAAHNLGQLLAASVLFGISVIPAYLPIMMPASVIFGGLCGLLLNFIMPRIAKAERGAQ